ncbi:MAG: O-antigen ligase family protein [Oscillospiraceae bacterium]|jgi:hypothetical protein|nr:O-antigen ligase family protein [Oscillospiraceae bacterium]
MMRTGERWSKGLERLFLLYLFANPVLDILNGIYLYAVRTLAVAQPGWMAALTPSLLLRMTLLGLMGLYILLNRELLHILQMLVLVLVGLLSVTCEIFLGARYEFFADAQYIARFAYNIAALAVFTRLLNDPSRRDGAAVLLRRVFTWTALLMAGSIIACFVLSSVLPIRLGFFASADRFGIRGSSGFYFAANEAVAILMLLLPVTLSDFFSAGGFRDRKNWPRLIAPAAVMNAMLLVGTKTAFVALAAGTVFVLAYQFIRAKRLKDRAVKRRCWRLIAVSLALFLMLSVFGMAQMVFSSIARIGNIVEEERTEDSFSYLEDDEQRWAWQNSHPILRVLLSGREYYLRKAGENWAGDVRTVLFGIGRGTQAHIIEMDLFEMLFYYGLFGIVIMFFPFARRTFRLIRLPGKGLHRLSVLLALVLTFGYAFIAGHVYFSVTGGFYYVLMILYGELTFSAAENPAPCETSEQSAPC